jgi:hypothetical protein
MPQWQAPTVGLTVVANRLTAPHRQLPWVDLFLLIAFLWLFGQWLKVDSQPLLLNKYWIQTSINQ